MRWPSEAAFVELRRYQKPRYESRKYKCSVLRQLLHDQQSPRTDSSTRRITIRTILATVSRLADCLFQEASRSVPSRCYRTHDIRQQQPVTQSSAQQLPPSLPSSGYRRHDEVQRCRIFTLSTKARGGNSRGRMYGGTVD